MPAYSGCDAPGTWPGLNASVAVPGPVLPARHGHAGRLREMQHRAAFQRLGHVVMPDRRGNRARPSRCCPARPDVSKPTHTTVTRSGVKPENQASTKFCVVPVLPAIGRSIPLPAFTPVPCFTTPSIMLTSWNTLAGSASCLRSSTMRGGWAGVAAAAAGQAGGPPYHRAVRVLHAVDQRRRHQPATLVQRGVGTGLLQHRGLHRAQRRRQHTAAAVHFAERLSALSAIACMPMYLRHPDGDQVQRLLQRDAQRGRPAERAFIVARPPFPVRRIHHHRRVQEALAGREALLQRRQIHERLEARARLPLAWVARLNWLISKLQPPTMARTRPVRRIQRDQRALAPWESAAGSLSLRRPASWRLPLPFASGRPRLGRVRLDHHHVADMHDVGDRRGAAARACRHAPDAPSARRQCQYARSAVAAAGWPGCPDWPDWPASQPADASPRWCRCAAPRPAASLRSMPGGGATWASALVQSCARADAPSRCVTGPRQPPRLRS